jgi:alcohol dehydrogenase (cytochrome c)
MRWKLAIPLAASGLVFCAPSGGQDGADGRAPAFTVEDLSTRPTTSWITNGGTLTNQRYSPLGQIDRDTVAGLRGLWRTGMGSGTAPGNSGQAQILVFGDYLYVSNGDNDVFAMHVDTGEIRWSYDANPAPRAGSPFGKSNRGVALGEGKVFATRLDAILVALDQLTGEVAWQTEVASWEQGYSITSAPLYYDGLVITGVSGGVMGRRCHISAYDAETGALVWRFHTIPGPGELGHETWPQEGDAWEHGGAPVWQTPAVDPELGLIYFSTGNTGPVLNGAVREGDNLFANTIVALDVATGEYRWHFQQIHHDIWDLDAPNPVVLFDAEVNGEMRKGLVEVGKTGFAYILDRETGEPLIGIEERPVAQEPRQHTSPTQPFPIGDPIVPQSIDIPPEGAPIDPETGRVFNDGAIFTPFWDVRRIMKPNPQGGANWPPSSLDPNTNILYVCATDRVAGYALDLPLEPVVDNVPYFGGGMGTGGAVDIDGGIFAALDVTTNRIVWRQRWREACYSGSVVTAGGLLFVGRSDGRLTALDARNGSKLWEFMTDAGVNTTVTTFERNGEQRVVVHAGGGVFANGRRGDGVWMFSLNGTMDPVAPAAPAGPAGVAAIAAAAPDTGRAADLARGQTLYAEACLPCHGASGTGGEGGGAPLVEGQSVQQILTISQNGQNRMPAFAEVYDPNELFDIASYVAEVLGAE